MKSCSVAIFAVRALVLPLLIAIPRIVPAQDSCRVVAYWFGDASGARRHAIGELSQIDFSFLHLRGSSLSVDNAGDSVSIRRLVALKDGHPRLRVLLSLGGWGGCETCSELFGSEEGRRSAAASAKRLLEEFHADGIDLDWEYPTIEGYPGHRHGKDDRHAFTLLLRQLRETLGAGYLITFAAGGFDRYLREAVEWDQVMPIVDQVNIMTYDLVNASSTRTGHLAPLYSTPEQEESTDHAVRLLDSIGVPRNKMVIGMAFYARTWSGVRGSRNGLFQPGTFESYIPFKDFPAYLRAHEGFHFHWDSVAQAPYAYNPALHLYATYDNQRSVALKTDYAIERHLGGVMFWDLSEDSGNRPLLDAIARARASRR